MNPHPTAGGSHLTISADPQVEYRRFVRERGDHVARFRLAFRELQGPAVLDYGSGSGFAAFFLPSQEVSYVGVEPDETPLRWSREHLATSDSRLTFLPPTDFWSKSASGSFDLVMALEVIEHVSQPRELLRRLSGLVRKGGAMIVSTPNGNLSRGEPLLFQSPFHLTEFNPTEFVGLLTGLGSQMSVFKQYRVDRMDVVPQLVKWSLTNWDRVTQSTRVSGTNRHESSWLYRTWALLPSPSIMWRVRPYRPSDCHRRSFSHLVAVVNF